MKRAKQPEVGIGWNYDSSGRFWCVNCEARLSTEIGDDGHPYVANHLDVNDCGWEQRKRDIWNKFAYGVMSR